MVTGTFRGGSRNIRKEWPGPKYLTALAILNTFHVFETKFYKNNTKFQWKRGGRGPLGPGAPLNQPMTCFCIKRGERGQRRHPSYTPFSIGNSSRVIFKTHGSQGGLDNSQSHSANVFRVDDPRLEARVLHELTQKKMANKPLRQMGVDMVADCSVVLFSTLRRQVFSSFFGEEEQIGCMKLN